MDARHVLLRTQRFNLSIPKEHLINPDCFGEDLAAWLRDKLVCRGTDVPQLGQEDWGWYLKVKCDQEPYFLGMNGIPIETDQNQKNASVDNDATVLQMLRSDGDTPYTENSLKFALPERANTGRPRPSSPTCEGRSR